jgi:hypothetical protein
MDTSKHVITWSNLTYGSNGVWHVLLHRQMVPRYTSGINPTGIRWFFMELLAVQVWHLLSIHRDTTGFLQVSIKRMRGYDNTDIRTTLGTTTTNSSPPVRFTARTLLQVITGVVDPNVHSQPDMTYASWMMYKVNKSLRLAYHRTFQWNI